MVDYIAVLFSPTVATPAIPTARKTQAKVMSLSYKNCRTNALFSKTASIEIKYARDHEPIIECCPYSHRENG